MTRIIAVYSIFNAQGLIYNSLVSVARAVDEIRIYDARYSEYACTCGLNHDNSCDRTRQEVEQFVRDYRPVPIVDYVEWPTMPEI